MSPWFGKALVLAGMVASVAIRWPHDERRKKTRVVESRRGGLETFLLGLMVIGAMVLPVLAMATPFLAFADHALPPAAFAAGAASLAASLWLFYRSHADLGTNWSPTLEVRENHRLVTSGVYERVRHPMYTAIFAHALAQALLLPNWIAGPAMLVTFTLMFALRFRVEERMMLEKFGDEYRAYMARTKRLVPGVW